MNVLVSVAKNEVSELQIGQLVIEHSVWASDIWVVVELKSKSNIVYTLAFLTIVVGIRSIIVLNFKPSALDRSELDCVICWECSLLVANQGFNVVEALVTQVLWTNWGAELIHIVLQSQIQNLIILSTKVRNKLRWIIKQLLSDKRWIKEADIPDKFFSIFIPVWIDSDASSIYWVSVAVSILRVGVQRAHGVVDNSCHSL